MDCPSSTYVPHGKALKRQSKQGSRTSGKNEQTMKVKTKKQSTIR
nr:MAG TPA: hypothetical protein [Microviridae sp.]